MRIAALLLALRAPVSFVRRPTRPILQPAEATIDLLDRLTQTQKTVLAVVALPVLVMLFSLWQAQRTPSMADQAEEIVRLQTFIAELQQMKPFEPVKGPDGKSYAPSLLIGQAQAELEHLSGSGGWRYTAPALLAKAAVLLSLIAAVLGGLGLAHIKRMGRQARESRAALIATFRSGQKQLPWFLAAFSTLLMAAIACSVTYELVRLFWSGALSRGDMKVILVGALGVLALLYTSGQIIWNLFKASRAAFEFAPLEIMGRNVTPQEAPRLWGFVRDIAARIKAKTPDAIVVGLNECFFVTEHSVRLSSGEAVPPGRVLYMPLPYMAFMSRHEAAAVIGHELGHFTGEDTEYSLHFAPIYTSAVSNLIAVHQASDDDFWEWLTKPVMFLGEFFLHSFDEAVQFWSRKRELAADQAGALAAGREAAAMALMRISVLAPRINEALLFCWEKGENAGGGVLTHTRRLIQEKGLDDPRTHLEEQQAHPTDSHPTTRQRLDALGANLNDRLMQLAQDPRGSRLLTELGLDGEASAYGGQTAPGAVRGAPVDVSKALEGEFSSAAQSDREQKVEFLQELGSVGVETAQLYEGGFLIALLLVIVGCGVVVGPFLIGGVKLTSIAMSVGAGLLFLAGGLHVLQRRRSPLMTLSAAGFQFANLERPLPWTAVENYSAVVQSQIGFTSIGLTVDLAEGCEPVFSGDRRVKFRKKKRQLVISTFGVRGMSSDDFLATFDDYWKGGLARAGLEAMQDQSSVGK